MILGGGAGFKDGSEADQSQPRFLCMMNNITVLLVFCACAQCHDEYNYQKLAV